MTRSIAGALLALACGMVSSGTAWANETLEVSPSVRALGMGNAYLGVVRDADSLFYNPAGLARVSGFNWLIADPYGGVDGMQALTTVSDLMSSSNFEAALKNHYGDYVWGGAGAKTAFTMPYLGVGIYDHLNASLDIDNPVYPNLDVSVVNDYGYTIGTALPLLPGLSVGSAIRYIKRTGSREPFGPSFISTLDPTAIRSSIEKKGNGYAMDLGLNLAIPGPVSPVFSVVWRDIGVTSFQAETLTLSAPPRQLDEIAVGAAINVDLPGFSIAPAFDFRYLNRTDIQLLRKVHLGVEIGIPLIDIRAGFSEGYYTLGAGLSMGIIRFDAATYGVELGEYPGQREDRRYMVQVTLEIGFDPSLGFLGGGGGGSGKGAGGKGGTGSGGGSGGRRLKQRR